MLKRMARRDFVLWTVFMLAVLIGVFGSAVWAFAADGDIGTPWDDVLVTFGAVTVAWASVQMGLIRILRGISVGGKPLLGTDGMIWLANAVLGVIGMTLAATQADQTLLTALVQAVLVVFAASGQHEFLAKTGKKS